MGNAWESLDANGRRFGVFACEGYSPDPIAIFSSEQDANDWMSWQASRGDDNALGGCDYTICAIERLGGRVWNSVNEPTPDIHWPDCIINHGGAVCDMGPECGDTTRQSVTEGE